MTETLPETSAQRLGREVDAVAAAEGGDALARVALGLSAAFLAYRGYAQYRLREEVNKGKPITRRRLIELTERLFEDSVPRFVATAVPPLMAGYATGLREARIANRSPKWIEQVSTHYARRLGEHIHEVSSEALVDGFTAQLNRRVPARMAADRVIDAFGVAPRTMKALVSIWLGPAPVESKTALPLRNPIKERADRIIAKAITDRAEAIGETEAFSAKNQAKVVQWAYRASKGELPEDARVVWYTARDERVCPTCGPMHGKTRKPEEKFELPNGDKLWAPQVHPRCRCDVVLVHKVTNAILEATLAQAQMLDESRELETVSKALSRWEQENRPKRGPDGKFSRVESRQRTPQSQRPALQYKEPVQDPAVAELVRQAYAQQSSAQSQDSQPTLNAAPSLDAIPSLSAAPSLDTPTLSSPSLSAPTTSSPELARPQLADPELRSPELSIQMPKLTIKAPDIELVNANKPTIHQGTDKWMNTPENRPIYGVFMHDGGFNGLLHADESTPWYDSHADSQAFVTALDEYWGEIYEGVHDMFESNDEFNPANRHIVMRRNGSTYYVHLDNYVDVFNWAMGGNPEDWMHTPMFRSAALVSTGRRTSPIQASMWPKSRCLCSSWRSTWVSRT